MMVKAYENLLKPCFWGHVSHRKLDFSHHDSPAAMFAVYDATGCSNNQAEAAAKGLSRGVYMDSI